MITKWWNRKREEKKKEKMCKNMHAQRCAVLRTLIITDQRRQNQGLQVTRGTTIYDETCMHGTFDSICGTAHVFSTSIVRAQCNDNCIVHTISGLARRFTVLTTIYICLLIISNIIYTVAFSPHLSRSFCWYFGHFDFVFDCLSIAFPSIFLQNSIQV